MSDRLAARRAVSWFALLARERLDLVRCGDVLRCSVLWGLYRASGVRHPWVRGWFAMHSALAALSSLGHGLFQRSQVQIGPAHGAHVGRLAHPRPADRTAPLQSTTLDRNFRL